MYNRLIFYCYEMMNNELIGISFFYFFNVLSLSGQYFRKSKLNTECIELYSICFLKRKWIIDGEDFLL